MRRQFGAAALGQGVTQSVRLVRNTDPETVKVAGERWSRATARKPASWTARQLSGAWVRPTRPDAASDVKWSGLIATANGRPFRAGDTEEREDVGAGCSSATPPSRSPHSSR